MEFKKSMLIDRPVDEVWEVLGNQYTAAYKWAAGLYHSEGEGTPKIEGAACNNRSCDTSFGRIKEEIRAFDADNFKLSYEVIEGFPFFVDKGINNWKLMPKGNKTQVDMHLVVTTKGLMGAIMGPMMKLQMGKTIATVLDDLKYYVENGKPSPAKAKELARAAKKAA